MPPLLTRRGRQSRLSVRAVAVQAAMAGPPRGAPGSGSSDPAGLRVLLLPWSGLEVLNGTAGAAVGSGSCSPSV